jgi:hypothetical protein
MDKQHVLVILDTLYNNIDTHLDEMTYDMNNSGTRLRYIKHDTPRGWVKVEYNPSYLELRSQVVANTEKPMYSSIRFNFFTKHFSVVYRKWRSLGRKIENIDKIESGLKKILEEKENDERFNRSYYELFPDSIEGLFLGEDDDE